MNDILDFKRELEAFLESHNMVNEFQFIKDAQQINFNRFVFRSVLMKIVGANISREAGKPTYDVVVDLLVLDRVSQDDENAYVASIQENMFVLGQIQDFLQQEHPELDFSMDEVNNIPFESQEYNLTGASSSLVIMFPRDTYNFKLNTLE